MQTKDDNKTRLKEFLLNWSLVLINTNSVAGFPIMGREIINLQSYNMLSWKTNKD